MSYLKSRDPRLVHTLEIIQADYGDVVTIENKNKDLRKWGFNDSVDANSTTIMGLGAGESHEVYLSSNGITHVSSDDGGDTMDIDFYEGHDWNSGNLLFVQENTNVTLTGTSSKILPTPLARVTRARLTSIPAGNIYFHEGGATTGGIPNDKKTIHLIIPAGDIQSQKASTSISSTDYWIIMGATASVLDKASAWVQVRIEIKEATATQFYPITQWMGVSDSSGTINLLKDGDPYLIVPKNHDVRMVAIADGPNTSVAGGIIGILAN